MSVTVDDRDLRRIQKKLEKLGRMDLYKNGLMAVGYELKGYIAEYPPESDANRAKGPGSHWYVRGQGGRYHRIRDGGISQYKTSQDLGQSWAVRSEKGGKQVVVGTNVTYAPYVQDEEKQMPYHRKRKWITTKKVVEKHAQDAIDTMIKQIRRILDQ